MYRLLFRALKPLKSSLHFFQVVFGQGRYQIRESNLRLITWATRAIIILRIQIFRDIRLENILILEIQALFYFYIFLRLKPIR